MQQNKLISAASLFRYSEKSIGISGLKTREQRLYFEEHIKPRIKGCRRQPNGWLRDTFIFPLTSILDAIVALALDGIQVTAHFTTFGDKQPKIEDEALNKIANCCIEAVKLATAQNQ